MQFMIYNISSPLMIKSASFEKVGKNYELITS